MPVRSLIADLRELPGLARANPYAALALGAFLVAAYLCLVNLDYAALWHDEAPSAFIGKNLLERGDIVGWDGRNLVGGTNGRTLNNELRDVLPPLMYVLNAAGFAVFGVNEIGARVMHALVGILSLGLFWLLLRQHVRNHPRVIFSCCIFVNRAILRSWYWAWWPVSICTNVIGGPETASGSRR